MKKSRFKQLYLASTIVLVVMVLFISFLVFNWPGAVKICVSDGYEIKNVILFIGDGMGFNHIKTTKIYNEAEQLEMEKLPFKGKVITHSKDNLITDSAASATALATGVKTNNGQIGKLGTQNLENISKLVKNSGKNVGILTTENLHGATPSGFSAHANNRDDTADIITSQLTCDIDLFMGKESLAQSQYLNYTDLIDDEGYTSCSNYDELNSLIAEDKLFVALEDINPSGVTLKMMVEFALDFLSQKGEGFFLMAEGAYIDKKSHSNDVLGMISELLDFDNAVEYAVNWAEQRKDTAVIVTADHETGGLKIKGNNKNSVDNSWYTSDWHTAADVPLFTLGFSINLNTIDNTKIFVICKKLLSI